MTETLDAAIDDPLPRWSVADVYESLHAPDFVGSFIQGPRNLWVVSRQRVRDVASRHAFVDHHVAECSIVTVVYTVITAGNDNATLELSAPIADAPPCCMVVDR